MEKATIKFTNRIIEIPMNADLTQVEYFINKFDMKMNGSLPAEAAWWIDGIGELKEWEKIVIWLRVKEFIDWKSRDRQAEHGDVPDWSSKDLELYLV